MAAKTWTGSSSTSWTASGNWNPTGQPGSGDDVTVPGSATRSPTLSGSTTINSLTINGALSLTISGSSTVLTVTNGTTLSSSGGITGVGKITSNISVTAASGTTTNITASNGTLEVNGTVSHGGAGTFGLVINSASAAATLRLDAASAATSVTFQDQSGRHGTLALNTNGQLTLGSVLAVGSDTVTLAGANATLTDASGVTISTGTISGAGVVAAAVTASGAAHVTASGGTLEVTGKLTDSGSALVLTASAATATLKLDAAGSAAHTVTLNGGTLLLSGSTAALTVGTKLAVASGKVTLQNGATLTDASGVSITTGTISGAGVVAAAVAAGTSAGYITASGGTLEVTGAVTGSNLALAASGATDTLRLDAAGNTARTVTLNGGTLLLYGSTAALTVGTALAVTTGTISMTGGTLNDSSGLTLGAGARLTGYGTVNPGFVGTNAGTVTASGGTLTLTSNIAASSGLNFTIADTAASVLKLNGTVGGSNAFSFAGTHGAVELNHVTITTGGLNFAGKVSGLTTATSATPNLGTIDYINVQATITKVVLTDSTHIELYSNSTDLGTITLGSAVGSGIHVDWYADSSLTGHTIGAGTDIYLSTVVCFAPGTGILTPGGERPVESLREGDIVLTLSGEEHGPQPIRWIGRRHIDLTTHPQPKLVAPVRVQRGAFADTMPHTDLVLSPDHAVLVDGKLIAIRQLVNGATIRQETDRAAVDYFHIELEKHAILLAEGLPAESYLDTGNRGFFANAGAPLQLHPDLMDESDCPARAAASCAPFVWDEASVLPVWRRLAERAASLGQALPRIDTTTDPALHVLVKGRALRPLYAENGLYIFALRKGTAEVRLVSRAGAPADLKPWLDDRRRLGVCVERIVLRDASVVQEIPLDHPGLSQGWWSVERDGVAMRRHTNGDAVLPLPAASGPVILEIRLGGSMAYEPDAGERERVA